MCRTTSLHPAIVSSGLSLRYIALSAISLSICGKNLCSNGSFSFVVHYIINVNLYTAAHT